MRTRLVHLWETLSSSLWFVPATMTLVAFGLAIGSITFDYAGTYRSDWVYGGGPEGARQVLAAIAASMITVAGVAFSVTIVALTLASQQFGPRLLRHFMRDRGNQVVLGTFIATFTFSLIVLRTIRGGDGEFVPHASVTLAILFALASLGVLIYFIHHAAVTIQAPEVIATVASDLTRGIDRLFPEALGLSPTEDTDTLNPELARDFEPQADTIPSRVTGYLQSIDNDRLMKIASENDLIFRLGCRPGDFIIEGDALIEIKPCGHAADPMIGEVRDSFIFGNQRTHTQDIEFTVQQLVEVAVRALSPAFNDPITAVSCVDRLAAALCRLAERAMPSRYRYDDHGHLRVIVAKPVRFGEVLDAAFDPIRQYGRSSTLVTCRLLEAIALIARHVRREEDRSALFNHTLMIERGSHEGLSEERDRQKVHERSRAAIRSLQEYPEQELWSHQSAVR